MFIPSPEALRYIRLSFGISVPPPFNASSAACVGLMISTFDVSGLKTSTAEIMRALVRSTMPGAPLPFQRMNSGVMPAATPSLIEFRLAFFNAPWRAPMNAA